VVHPPPSAEGTENIGMITRAPAHATIPGGPVHRPAGGVRRRAIGTYVVILAATALAWIWAFHAFAGYPLLLGTALLAYTFGLRHAVDADHIAAIDNVTRKLMQDGQRPVNVGSFFALGHSLVVIFASAVVAITASALNGRYDYLKKVGGLISTSVSASFLLILAAMNIVVLVEIYRTFQRVKTTGRYVEEDLNLLMGKRGLLTRILRPLIGMVRHSWQMIPMGLLFGLGFDTSTEVALLGLSATGAAKGLSIWSIMVFPALFTAGMTLVDTTDGILMLGAYEWAFVTPLRKLYYNMTITSVSIAVALFVGGIETLGLLSGQLSLTGGFWDAIARLNENFNTIGFIIIGVFAAAWAISFLIYRLKNYDGIVVKTEPM